MTICKQCGWEIENGLCDGAGCGAQGGGTDIRPKEKDMGHHEYVRRNLLVCQAIGVRSGLNAILTRSDNAPYKTQKWITDGLRAELQRMSGVCEELAAHRDEKENLNGSS